jgi:hypothetical protein
MVNGGLVTAQNHGNFGEAGYSLTTAKIIPLKSHSCHNVKLEVVADVSVQCYHRLRYSVYGSEERITSIFRVKE